MNMRLYPSLSLPDNSLPELYHINMFYDETDKEKLPIITFVNDIDEPVSDIEELGLTGSELVKEAFKNLKSVDLNWQTISQNGATLLEIDNQRFAAEKILDKEFMKTAANLLKAEEIAVGLPVQDTIICCKADDEAAINILNEKIITLFNDFSRKQIAKWIFYVKDGGIIKKEAASEKEVKIQAIQSFPDGYEKNISKIGLFGSLYMIKVVVSAGNIEELMNGMFADLHNILLKEKRSPDFNGTIEFQSAVDQPRKSKTAVAALGNFFQKLPENPTLQRLFKGIDKSISVTFLFGTDFQSGDVHKKFKTTFSK